MDDELKSKLKSWVKDKRKSNMSESDIRNHLNEKNYPQRLINEAMRKGFNLSYVIVPLIIIIIGAAVYFSIPLISSLFFKTCLDENCFIDSANSCSNAKFMSNNAGTIFDYKTKDCILTKTLAKLNDSEPQEIKTLLNGKSMTCKYVAGDFNEEWITALSLGIDECSGDLKDAINELISSL